MRTKTILSLLIAVACTSLAGCGGKQRTETTTTTVGQELQDLDAARAKGLLTEDEYNRERKEILKRK